MANPARVEAVRTFGALCLLTVLALGNACTREASTLHPNIVLIVIDTLRADHCSVYGYERPTTPMLQELATRGATFETAYAPVGTTGPSHATLFTSKYPLAHGVVRNGLVLGDQEVTMAELLAQHGYRTAAFVSSFPVSRRFGLAQGFEHYDDHFDVERSTSPYREWTGQDVPGGFDRRGGETSKAVHAWLGANEPVDRPLFLWVHYYDPHGPYDPPPEYRTFVSPEQTRQEHWIAMYDGEVAYVEREVALLADLMLRRDEKRETLVIITSDHGEGLYDHGSVAHNRSTYEAEVRVPLIMLWPGRFPEGRRIAHPAHLIDVLPTIASAVGIDAGDIEWAGRDLNPFIAGTREPEPERALFMQRPYYPGGRRAFEEKGYELAVRQGRWKYIEAAEEGRRELYDVEVDPTEKQNLFSRHRRLSERLSARIETWRAEQEKLANRPPLEVGPDALERLRALGYLDDRAPANRP